MKLATVDNNTCTYDALPSQPSPGVGNFPTGGYGGGYPDVFPPVGSGISPGGPGPQMKEGADKPLDMLKKYWWVLAAAAVGYYMYNKNKNTTK